MTPGYAGIDNVHKERHATHHIGYDSNGWDRDEHAHLQNDGDP